MLTSSMLSRTVWSSLVVVAFACIEGDAPLVTRSYTDEGSLCLSPRGAGGSHVQVLIDQCASYCAEVEASCAASIVNGVIIVESEALTSIDRENEVCPDACQPVEVSCLLPELPDGNYELRFGARVATVTMPVPIAGTLVLAARPDADGDPCQQLPLLP